MPKEKNSVVYEYPRPSVTADAVIFGYDKKELNVLLVKRDIAPFKNEWSLPGGFLHLGESAEETVNRVIKQKTGLKNIFLEQLFTFTDKERDPRGHTISISYFSLVNTLKMLPVAGKNVSDVCWFPLNKIPGLAFDHKKIISIACNRLKGKISWQPVGFELLDKKFTLSQLQHLYEIILDAEIDKRNFRKKILQLGIVIPLNEKEYFSSKKGAELYSFNKTAYQKLVSEGFTVKII
ncbi:MAG: NUDIX hydrolase [Bacteroidota bacterium]